MWTSSGEVMYFSFLVLQSSPNLVHNSCLDQLCSSSITIALLSDYTLVHFFLAYQSMIYGPNIRLVWYQHLSVVFSPRQSWTQRAISQFCGNVAENNVASICSLTSELG